MKVAFTLLILFTRLSLLTVMLSPMHTACTPTKMKRSISYITGVMIWCERFKELGSRSPMVVERQIHHADSTHAEGFLLGEWNGIRGKGRGKTGLWGQMQKRRQRQRETEAERQTASEIKKERLKSLPASSEKE